MGYKENPERDQDRLDDALDNWRKYRYFMFESQRKIYENLYNTFKNARGSTLLEAGCGIGTGTAWIGHGASIIGTDKSLKNIEAARCLYPWVEFDVWDLNQPTNLRADHVIAVECLEHVGNYKAAIKNMVDAAKQTVWITTPIKQDMNGPSNPFHTREFAPQELIDLIMEHPRVSTVILMDWRDFSVVRIDDEHLPDPLVYRVICG